MRSRILRLLIIFAVVSAIAVPILVHEVGNPLRPKSVGAVASGMKQVFIGGSTDVLSTVGEEWNSLVSSTLFYWSSLESYKYCPWPTAGTFRNLRVKLSIDPGDPAGPDTFRFTLRIDGASLLTCDIVADNTVGSDLVHEVDVTAGQLVCLSCAPVNSPSATPYAWWSVEFEGDVPNESVIVTGCTADVSGERYSNLNSGNGNGASTDDYYSVCPTAGTIKSLYAKLSVDPGTSPDQYTVSLSKYSAGWADTTLTCSIVANDTAGHDTVHTVSVAAGDLLRVHTSPGNSPSGYPYAGIGMVFLADTNGESCIWGGLTDALHATSTEYMSVGSQPQLAWSTTEATFYQLVADNIVLKKLQIALTAAPGAGNSRVFTVRDPDGVGDTALVVTIAEAATTGNSAALTASISAGNRVTWKQAPISGPTVADAYWGLVCYISPLPTVTSTDPATGAQGVTNQDETITGTDLTGATVVSFGADVAVSDVVVSNSTTITCHITITLVCTPGTRNVAVTTPGGTGTATAAFTITATIAITNNSATGNTYNFGTVGPSATVNTGLDYFTVTNTGGVTVNITIHGHDMTGSGYTWTLSDDASRGSDIYGMNSGLEGGSYNIIVKRSTSYNTLKAGLAASGTTTQKWGLQFLSPSTSTGSAAMSGTVTLTATQA